MIPLLLDRLKEVDLGCMVDCTCMEESHTFERAFICPSMTRNALKYYHPVVCLDAYHTKNCKYPTQFFLATTWDGDSKICILCYVVAPIENLNNWMWFLKMM